MKNMDVITVWPRAFDYPLWRHQITRDRKLFNKVILSYTHNSVDRDFRPDIHLNYPDFTTVDTEHLTGNWYDVAINEALKVSKSDWVLFLEQDFLYREGFMQEFLEKCQDLDFACLKEKTRLHLGCFAVKRWLIEKTMKYFYTLNTPSHHFDCFDLFTCELQVYGNFKTLDEMGFIRDKDYDHLNGLTHNYQLLLTGKKNEITGKEKFNEYNTKCLGLSVPQFPEWLEVMKTYDN